jgi:hypothetical protein
MGVVEVFGALLSVIDGILKKLPSYEQRKKEKFYKLKLEYEKELSKDFPSRDDERIALIRSELLEYARTFSTEIQQ